MSNPQNTAVCSICGKKDSISEMVSQLSLFGDLENWFHACCKPEKKKKGKKSF